MWGPQMRSRCPSAKLVGKATISGWRAAYDKPSVDGSAKLNIRPVAEGSVGGVLWDIDDEERELLDLAEPLYDPVDTEVGLTYSYAGAPADVGPYDWYVSMVERAAEQHGLPVPSACTLPDPLAQGVRPADESDLPLLQDILSEGLAAGGSRYYSHPGELGWWMYHADDRHPFLWWVQGEDAFSIVDRSRDREIFVFGRPGKPLMPLVEWSQRLLGGRGEVAWVSEQDPELESDLRKRDLEPVFSWIAYEWDLDRHPTPEPRLPEGWSIRAVNGEHEADERRRASHAAFESSMDPQTHLERYLRFMRSPVYMAERDLVVVREDGRIGAFVVWWADSSGIAQIEPFGTHPEFQRMGLGRALLHHALNDMKAAGMSMARVTTDEPRAANAFYSSVGFENVGRLRNWALPSAP